MEKYSALTPIEVAEMLKISKNTVYELVKRGELNSYKVGNKLRIEMKDIEEYKNKSKRLQNTKQSNDDGINSYNSIESPYGLEKIQKSYGFVICGQDIMLDILSRHLQQHTKGFQALRSYIGSYDGLYALYHGNVQIATAHLWDGETGQYNVPYVKRMLPGIPAIIVHLANRMQGFYVQKGNPKEVRGWEDLKRSEIVIINREIGSGTRVLLDEHLKNLGIDGNNISGYDRECFSHLAVASTVARGGADIAIGNEKACQQVNEIDFIPLQTESYELVIKKEDIDKPHFQAVLQIIRSKEFKLELEGIGGYDLKDIGVITAET
ncbi:helix-turn-helix transcriptional regulator [Clostridium estertheticum]|uniref:substrate-binding domain-containing protein n=1 Tax=Clostridium estertheticum TaxID=238834 RepID=UPI001C0DCC37|nr:helix-turn-helix transcriptional regulator [Clostridium estertheticum]MBU3175945.1 helix-turn-helix transcriptional regulator [Clostridium estertheticum]